MNNLEVKLALESVKTARKAISKLNKEKAQSLKTVEDLRLKILEDNGYKMEPSKTFSYYNSIPYWKTAVQTKFFELRLSGDRIDIKIINEDLLKNIGFERVPWQATPVSIMRYAKPYIGSSNPVLSITAQNLYDDAKIFKDLLY